MLYMLHAYIAHQHQSYSCCTALEMPTYSEATAMAVSLWNGTRVMQDAGLERNRASVKYEQHTPCKRVVLLDGPLNGSSVVNATLGMPTYNSSTYNDYYIYSTIRTYTINAHTIDVYLQYTH